MLKCAIVEDCEADSHALAGLLAEYAEKNEVSFEIESFQNANAYLFAIHEIVFDIVFLDIEMPGCSGMDAAKEMRRMKQNSVLVFVTNMVQYAVNGYSVDAFDYLLKPLHYDPFALKLERIVRKAVNIQNQSVLVTPVHEETTRIMQMDIIYLDVEKHYVTWHTCQRVFQTVETLKACMGRLSSAFCVISRWNVVNMKYIDCIKDDEIMVSGEVLHLSRQHRQAFLQAFAMFMVGGK